MERSRWNWIAAAVAVMALTLGTSAAHAGTVFDVDFEVEITDNTHPLFGETYFGSFAYDDGELTGSGEETLYHTPASGEKGGFLSVDFLFDGVAYDETDDVDYTRFPAVLFVDGVLSGLDYITGDFGITSAEFYDDDEASDAIGTVTYSEPVARTCTVIPLPAAVWPGLVLMGAVALKRRRGVA